MNFEFRELINPEKYYYFSIISQIPIWTVFLINLFSQNSNGNDVFNDQSNPNYYMPARIFEPCQSCLLIREQVWRLVSYSFIHIDFNHLFFNSLGLLIYSYINEWFLSKK